MINALTSPSTSDTSSTPKPASATAGLDPLASENTFLTLLVTQLKNQDPLNPQDGTQFVAQLAQFSGLEQTIQMRQDLDQLAATGTATPQPPAPANKAQ